MTNEFSTPQRQAPLGVMVMFFDTVRQFAGILGPALVLWIVNNRSVSLFWISAALIVSFLGICLIAFLKYRNFTFYIDDKNAEFILSSGILNKTRTVIRLDKIQQVNIAQSLIQRIIGVYAIDVDTAGGSEKEATIRAVSHPMALSLKQRLLENERKVENDASASVEETNQPFVSIGFASLLKVGFTSNYIKSLWLLLAFFATIYDNIRHLKSTEYATGTVDYIEQRFAMSSAEFIVIALLCALLVLNVLRTVVRYFGYNIVRQKGSLLLSFGLINTKSTILKPEKVQLVAITRNYFQKKMDISEIRIRQAAAGHQQEKNLQIDIPGCSTAEQNAILELLFKQLPSKGEMMKPNWRKLVFSLFLTIVLPLIVLFLLRERIMFNGMQFLVPIYIIMATIILTAGFINYRIFINDEFIIKQSGAWDISNEIIEPAKIQAITTSQLFWHKSLNIGSLTIHTASGNVSFSLGNFARIREYVNQWLYELERSDSNWM